MAKYRDAEFAKWARDTFDWNLTPELTPLPVDDMPEDKNFEAQRDLDGERAAGLADCFIPIVSVGVLVAVVEDGHKVFIDGQHRWKAAQIAGETHILALVFHMPLEQAAAFFRLRNGPAVVNTSHMDATIAAEVSSFPPVLEMEEVLQQYGCYLDRGNHRIAGAIGSSTCVEAIYRVDDGVLLGQALDVITECWGNGTKALSKEVLTATALFLGHWSDRMDAQRRREMRKQFRDKGLETLLADATEMWTRMGHGSGKGRVCYIEAEMLSTYNYNRQVGPHRLPDNSAGALARMGGLDALAKHRRAA